MHLPLSNLQHVSSTTHQGKALFFGVDGNRTIHYCLKLEPPVESAHFTTWRPLPLPGEGADESVLLRERDEGIDGLVASVYDSGALTAAAPVQAVSVGEHIHLFRQSTAGTLLVDRFVLDVEAGRLNRKIEVRYKRSGKRHTPRSPAAGATDSDTRDFRGANGEFFLEPSSELRLVDRVVDGRFAVVATPSREADRLRWHIFSWDPDSGKLRVTSLRQSEEALFDLRDHTVVDGDPDQPVHRLLPGIVRRTIDLRDVEGQRLEPRGAIAAVVHDLQRELPGEDGETHLVKTERRILVAASLGDPARIAALSFTVDRDGALAEIAPNHQDIPLREYQQDVRLPSDLLDRLETWRDDRCEQPPARNRGGLLLDGSPDSHVATRAAIELADTSFTIELWLRRGEPREPVSLVLGQGRAEQHRGLHLGYRGSRFLFGFWQNDLQGPEEHDQDWHHWACVYTLGGPRQLFRDGVKVAEDQPPPYLGAGTIRIGSAFGFGFPGTVADVRIWRRARTAAEIEATRDVRLSGRELGLTAHWPLDAIVDGQVVNNVSHAPEPVHGAVHRSGRVLSRKLSDDYTFTDRYRHPALFPVAERSTYVVSFELRPDHDVGGFDFLFTGENLRGEAFGPTPVPARLEDLPDGWKRATARFTTQVGATRLRPFDFTAPLGSWRWLEVRNHRLARVHGTMTETRHDESVMLTTLAPNFAELLQTEQKLDDLEAQEARLAQRLQELDAALAGIDSEAAHAAAIARANDEIAAQTAVVGAAEADEATRRAEREHAERHFQYGGTLALKPHDLNYNSYITAGDEGAGAGPDRIEAQETFTIQAADDPGKIDTICFGDWVALRAHTGKYLSIYGARPADYEWILMDTGVGPGARWRLLNPGDPDDRSPVPRGATVAFRSEETYAGTLHMKCNTRGDEYFGDRLYAAGWTVEDGARFILTPVSDSVAVAPVRSRHQAAEARLQAQRQLLDGQRQRLAAMQVRRLAVDRAAIQADRDRTADELIALQTTLASRASAHLELSRQLEDAAMTLPPLTDPARPLAVEGAVLGFASIAAGARPTLLESIEGAVHLYFAGSEGRLRRCVYDSVDRQWRPDLLGACLRLRGGSTVVVPHHPAYSTASFTIELWARPRYADATVEFLTARGLAEMEIHLGGDISGGLRFLPVRGHYVDTAPHVLRPGEWVHIACVFTGDADHTQIYLDGKPATARRVNAKLPRQPSSMPLRLGRRSDESFGFTGDMADVRLWSVALTAEEIAAQMHVRLSGFEPGLVGWWPLRDGAGQVARDHSRGARHGAITDPIWSPRTAPAGRIASGCFAQGGVPGGFTTRALVACEYAGVEGEGEQRQAMLRRALAWPTADGVEVLPGQRVDTLELRWLGNVQMNPTLVGYIEGAPPVPSENLTVKSDYNGASSVEFRVADTTTATITTNTTLGIGGMVEAAAGSFFSGKFGVSVIVDMAVDAKEEALVKMRIDESLKVSYEYSRTGTSTVTTSEKLSLKGERERTAALPQLGLRFVPKNVGYATVVSIVADMFVLRTRGNKRMVSHQLVPAKDIPPDVNVITFMINPAYTLNGSLDGQVGTSPADDRLYGHVPDARSQVGSAVDASYYRLREAYAIRDVIDRANRGAEALAVNLKADLLSGIAVHSGPLPTEKTAIQQGANEKSQDALDAANAEVSKQKGRQLDQVIRDAPKGNIVNTYVWDGDGGLRMQSQTFATAWKHVLSGTYSLEVGIGFSLEVAFGGGFAAKFNAMGKVGITETVTGTTGGSRAIDLNVLLNCENQGITDNRDRPLLPGEKVDRYRFMSFALQPSTSHFADFFARVVDPEWLASNDEEAHALRQIDQRVPNQTWRVLHRVTYVERPTRRDG